MNVFVLDGNLGQTAIIFVDDAENRNASKLFYKKHE